jgi:hypothetical protein
LNGTDYKTLGDLEENKLVNTIERGNQVDANGNIVVLAII